MNLVLVELFLYRNEVQILVGLYGTCKEFFFYLNGEEQQLVYGEPSFHIVVRIFCRNEIWNYARNNFSRRRLDEFMKFLYIYNFDFVSPCLCHNLRFVLKQNEHRWNTKRMICGCIKRTSMLAKYEELKIWLYVFYEVYHGPRFFETLEECLAQAQDKNKVNELVTEIIYRNPERRPELIPHNLNTGIFFDVLSEADFQTCVLLIKNTSPFITNAQEFSTRCISCIKSRNLNYEEQTKLIAMIEWKWT